MNGGESQLDVIALKNYARSVAPSVQTAEDIERVVGEMLVSVKGAGT